MQLEKGQKWYDARCKKSEPKQLESASYYVTGEAFGPVFGLCIHKNQGDCPDFSKADLPNDHVEPEPKKKKKFWSTEDEG
jgi:hypothetical protein